MKVRDIMTANPVCCLPSDSAQAVAQMMCQSNIGSVPVVTNYESRTLTGMITDRDLCCSVVAQNLNSASTAIVRLMRADPIACGPDDGLDHCERLMQMHQVRRVPVIDQNGRCIGIVAQADLALAMGPQDFHQTVAAISRPLAA